MQISIKKPDSWGAVASALCVVHCVATPLIFVAQTCSASCHSAAPTWWRWIDYLFLIIAFFAVYRSTKTTSSAFMKQALWVSWAVLSFVVINEKVGILELPEFITYIAAFILITLHLYNLNYCQCQTASCCATHKQ